MEYQVIKGAYLPTFTCKKKRLFIHVLPCQHGCRHCTIRNPRWLVRIRIIHGFRYVMKQFLLESVQTVLLVMVIFMPLQACFINFQVAGSSMQPTLQPNQYVLVNRVIYADMLGSLLRRYGFDSASRDRSHWLFSHEPRRGEIIVFRKPNEHDRSLVKRIIGMPGDTVAFSEGFLFINGKHLEEPYLPKSVLTTHAELNMQPQKIGKDEYFVMGDNRFSSVDSRFLGPIPRDLITGQAFFVYWPFQKFGLIN